MVGVPLHTPEELNERPGTPLLALQLYGGLPPPAVRVTEYGLVKFPTGSGDAVVIVRPAGLMVNWRRTGCSGAGAVGYCDTEVECSGCRRCSSQRSGRPDR